MTSSSESSPSKDGCSTQEWLEHILESYYGVNNDQNEALNLEVTKWDINPVEGESYLSELLSLDVSYLVRGEEKRVKLVAKLLPSDPRNRAFVIETRFDMREINFYTEIAPALEEVTKRRIQGEDVTLPIPVYYHAVHKKDAESILVMEDLGDKGFSVQNLTDGLTIQQAEKAVECLAQIHSASIALQLDSNKDLKSLYPYLLTTEKAEEAFHALFEKGLPLLLKYLEKKPEHSVVRTRLQEYGGNRSRDIFQRVLSPSDKINTLVHCDFWSNNLLFREINNTTQCRIVDFQMIMQGKPTIDLGMLIATSLTSQARRDHEDNITSTYWNFFLMHLSKLGIKDKDFNYTLDDLKNDLKDSKLFGALVMIGSVDMALGMPKREDRVLSLIRDLIDDGSL